jgi:hypothetical protein
VDESSTILFTLFNLRNSRLSGLISGFALKVYTSQGYLIMSLDKSSTSASVRVVPGILAGLVVTPDNYRTRALVGYAFRFSLANPVGTGDGMQLVLPETIGVVS